jgi:hypothetical protein
MFAWVTALNKQNKSPLSRYISCYRVTINCVIFSLLKLRYNCIIPQYKLLWTQINKPKMCCRNSTHDWVSAHTPSFPHLSLSGDKIPIINKPWLQLIRNFHLHLNFCKKLLLLTSEIQWSLILSSRRKQINHCTKYCKLWFKVLTQSLFQYFAYNVSHLQAFC